MAEVQDVFKQFGAEFLSGHVLSPSQYKAFLAIKSCRTAVLGAHVDSCNECGFEKISYNSCRNRHCPKRQTLTKEQWVEKQNQYLLNTRYFHLVFTLPDGLNSVMLQNQEQAYGLFFKAVSETLFELCADKKYLGATPGVTTVLHTWGQNLMYHPHIHCIVTGGGLTKESNWNNSRKNFFLPVKVLSRKFKGKFLFLLKQARLPFNSTLYRNEWVVYCKPPFKSASKVIEYLGRYTHRVAISNYRILSLKDGKVTFSLRDYRDNNKKKTMIIMATEFIRRFMLHILPSGFRKIRHYGILASRNKNKKISLCRKLTMTKFKTTICATSAERLQKLFGADFDLCPCCGIGHMARGSPQYKATA
ncbi:MAG: IS91 family transposase [Oscillospiraceae bacterium]|nr:IS91 family transposase [Oscillospiraceae bacterium]